MEVEKVQTGEKTVYHVSGRIDTQTSPELQKLLEVGFEEGENKVVLDLKETVYLSSAGLRVILYAQKRIDDIKGGSLTVVNVAPVVMEVFNMTGFTDFMKIEEAKT